MKMRSLLLRKVSRGVSRRGPEGFILMETMLAVAIFAIAVLSLAQCVEQCLKAEIFKEEDAKARVALQNKMAELESGAAPPTESKEEKLEGEFKGMVMKTESKEFKAKNEKEEDIVGLYTITLTLEWLSNGEKASRSLQFYVYPKR